MKTPNQYQAQLLKNYGKPLTGKDRILASQFFPKLPSYNTPRSIIGEKAGMPISQKDLQQMRWMQANTLAGSIFDHGTDQYDAAKKYLMSRGAQNQERYRQGTLEKNTPTEVKMPTNIPESKRQQLDQLGRLMVQNKKPSYSQQLNPQATA